MRALRGLTATTVAALLVAFASTGAAADPAGDGEPPVAEVNAGNTVAYVPYWEAAASRDVRMEWTESFGTALSAPRAIDYLVIMLPWQVASSVKPETAELRIEGFTASGSASVDPVQESLQVANDFNVNVRTVLTELAGKGLVDPVTRLRATLVASKPQVPGTEPALSATFVVDVLLTDAPWSNDVIRSLQLPTGDALFDQYTYVTGPVRATAGTRVDVVALEDFWAHGPVSVGLRNPETTASITLDGGAVAVDWDTVQVTMPADSASYTEMTLASSLADDVTFVVVVPLLPPSADAVEAYVTSVYNDLFDRDPDPTGLAGWTGALMRGVPYSAVSDAITSSDEFRMGLITDAYWKYLGRGPDPAGLAGWLRAMNRGMPIQQMEAGFLASQEYYDVWGDGYDAGWIVSLYVDVLGRRPSVDEVSAWLPAIERLGREEVSRGFLYSWEKLATDVDGYYWWLLHRGLDPVGRDGWVRAIQGGHRVEEIIAGIIASQEYRNNVPVG